MNWRVWKCPECGRETRQPAGKAKDVVCMNTAKHKRGKWRRMKPLEAGDG